MRVSKVPKHIETVTKVVMCILVFTMSDVDNEPMFLMLNIRQVLNSLNSRAIVCKMTAEVCN